jgi:hypothetical protein
MKELKKYHSLFEMAPSLVKEWHPTANGKLTPRNLEVDYPKKVWWICSASHEWQATIKNRMNQNDCPICIKESVIKTSDADSGISVFGRDFRNEKRYEIKALLVIEVLDSEHWLYAEIKNISSHGFCFEMDTALTPGSRIKIQFDKVLVLSKLDKPHLSSYNDGYKTYNSIIKWCKKMDDDQSISNFAIGAKVV